MMGFISIEINNWFEELQETIERLPEIKNWKITDTKIHKGRLFIGFNRKWYQFTNKNFAKLK